ncbi:MAG: NAD-dependent SIR2 family protein deacetylase [Halieaceae bacterium]|jgi:NAD-dependent SIR2 family protein deacetylase
MTKPAPDIARLQDFLARYPRLVVLTGAGVSAASGIPTYRDQDGNWKQSDPIQHQDFIEQPAARKRYWARSALGWPKVSQATPNTAHRALAQLEANGHVELLITQNVDRLHQRSGSRRVVDLHGRLDEVNCLDCGATYKRDLIQILLQRNNPALFNLAVETLPDGDADLADHYIHNVNVPVCERCAGRLMPNVVFFGGGVPKSRVKRCMDSVAKADALLSIGSSLQVLSGYRFCRRAHELGKPVVLINPGTTRADSIAFLKLTSPCAPLLEQLLEPTGYRVLFE